MASEDVPGLALALIDEGRIVHVAAYGLRNVERDLPLERDTVMYAASLTKTAVAYLVLQLVDEAASSSTLRSIPTWRSRCPNTRTTPTSPATNAGAA